MFARGAIVRSRNTNAHFLFFFFFPPPRFSLRCTAAASRFRDCFQPGGRASALMCLHTKKICSSVSVRLNSVSLDSSKFSFHYKHKVVKWLLVFPHSTKSAKVRSLLSRSFHTSAPRGEAGLGVSCWDLLNLSGTRCLDSRLDPGRKRKNLTTIGSHRGYICVTHDSPSVYKAAVSSFPAFVTP